MSADWPGLGPDEEEVTEAATLWYRQANPDRLTERGTVSPQVFELNSQERSSNRSSGALSSLQTAKGAYEDGLVMLEAGTAGTWAVSVEEAEQAGFRVIDDSRLYEPPPTGHGSLDHHAVAQRSKRARQAAREELANAAVARGCLFPVADSSDD